MKTLNKAIVILFFITLSSTAGASVYYVSPRGLDANDGLDTASNRAWLTWLKAFNTATAGDTVYFLGGNYLHPSPESNIGPANSGTPSSFIYFMAYPGQIPTLDCSNKTRTGYSYAIYLASKSYIYFKGLHFKDNHQLAIDHIAGGTNLYQCNYIVFEDCKSYSHGYTGFADGTCDSIFYINCDSYLNYNANMSSYSGGGSDGFYTTGGSTGNLIKYTNCRAWFNSDDGWDSMYNDGLVVWEGCWSLSNGYDLGDGTGFKLGHISSCDGTLQRLLTRCLSVNNKWSGFNENNNGRPSSRIECYNNMSYRDMYGFMNINSSDDTYNRVYRNNIAYGFTTAATYLFNEPNITHDHNTWNEGITVSDADFVSLDTVQLYGSRQSDGLLPYTQFGHLASTSELIDAGIDIGLPFAGDAPDIGWFESGEIDETATDILTFTLSDQTGSATINTTTHAISTEIVWDADITSQSPTITLAYGATIVPTSGTARDFTTPQTYTVTALDETTTQEWVVTVTQAEEPAAPATTYYVSPTGNDSNPGTISQPWLTWQKAFQTANAGDTVFYRGGTYPQYPTDGHGIRYNPSASQGHDGTEANPIVHINYPGETPILDGSNVTTPSFTFLYATMIINVDWVEFHGLYFQNFKQISASDPEHVVQGVYTENCTNIIWNRCVARNMGGIGWLNVGPSIITYNNCDAYNCCDSIGHKPGDYGSGFSTTTSEYTGHITYNNCRAWKCSDQGFGTQGQKSLVTYNSCWSFNNGAMPTGGGHGFKMGYMNSDAVAPLDWVYAEYYNCVAAYNRDDGFTSNDNGYPAQRLLLYNNIAYHNGYYTETLDFTPSRMGFNLYVGTGLRERQLYNNISYDNYSGNRFLGPINSITNSWDTPPNPTVTDADFVSVDSTGITAARQADGSLPNNDCYNYFLRLAMGSNLIDAGTDVGLSFTGTAPDLGWAEYDGETASTATDILTFTLSEQTGAATINTTNHTVAIEVAYTADITSLTPTITLSYGATVIPLSGVARDFTNPVPYTVTAEDGVTHQEWTVTVTQEEEPVDPPTSSSKIVKLGGLILKL